MSALSDRLQQPDVVNLPDWQAADALNSPDPSLPCTLVRTQVGPGLIMATLGAASGAALLDRLTMLSDSVPAIKWALKVIDRGDLDLSSTAARDQIDEMLAAQILSENEATALKALANGPHQSWAQANGIEVTPRTVGLARGAR